MAASFRYWILAVLLISAALLFQRLRSRGRERALSEVAKRLGFHFELENWSPRSSGPQLKSPHFTHTYVESFRNSMSGERSGLAASFFDHVIRSGHGANHTDTIASFTQSISLPEFALAQQDVFSKIGDAVLHRQIDFSSDPGFSARFRLIGTDEDRIRELFTADMREFLTGIEPEWSIEASGHTLVIYQAGYAVKADEYADFVDETTDVAKKFFLHCRLKKPSF